MDINDHMFHGGMKHRIRVEMSGTNIEAIDNWGQWKLNTKFSQERANPAKV